MTEESYQQCRKVMQQINYKRSLITKAMGEVAKWTKIEDVHRREFREGQANGSKKCLEKALTKLTKLREQFAAIKFPDSDIIAEIKRCEECGKIIGGNNHFSKCECEEN